MMEQSLSLSQKQTLKLNTQMLQSLELMTLPLAELQAKIENELLENPTLHADDSASHVSYEEYVKGQIREESHTDSYSDSSAYGSDLSDSHQAWLEGALSSRETLEEHLMNQLGSAACSDDVRETASLIISSLDENGFYPSDLDSLLSARQKEHRDEALTLLHSFDPSGVCARDFRDSLVIQARNLGLEGDELEVFRRMVYEELDSLRSGKFAESAVFATSASCWGLHAKTTVCEFPNNSACEAARAMPVCSDNSLPVLSSPQTQAIFSAPIESNIPLTIAPAILPAPTKPNFFILFAFRIFGKYF